jgi:hypothetical protein
MNTIGYAIYGRPTGFEIISNGAIKDLGIEDMLYIQGPFQGQILQPGESFYLLERIQNIQGNYWLFAHITFARSYSDNREGGFMGSSIAFTGIPSAPFLTQAIHTLDTYISREVEPGTFKFKAPSKNTWQTQILPTPEEGYLLRKENPFLTAINTAMPQAAMYLDAEIESRIGGIIQSCILNSQFNGIGRIVFSTHTNHIPNGLPKIQPIDIFDFSYQNGIILKAGDEYQKQTKELVETIQQKKSELEKVTKDIQVSEQKIEEIKQHLAGKQSELSSAEQNYQAIQQANNASFEQLKTIHEVNFKAYVQGEKSKIENQYRYQLDEANQNITFQKEQLRKRHLTVNILKLGIVFIFLIASGLTYLYFFSGKDKGKNQLVKDNSHSEVILPVNLDAPIAAKMNKDEWNSHRKHIRHFLTALMQEDLDLKGEKLQQLLTRKWHPMELFESDTTMVNGFLNLYLLEANLKRIHRNPGTFNLCSNKGGKFQEIPGLDSTLVAQIQVHSNVFFLDSVMEKNIEEKKEKLEGRTLSQLYDEYTKKPGNLYKKSGIDVKALKNNGLLMHFQWLTMRYNPTNFRPGRKTDKNLEITLPYLKK